jgi:O-antigen/teichoic acid export membrane protein
MCLECDQTDPSGNSLSLPRAASLTRGSRLLSAACGANVLVAAAAALDTLKAPSRRIAAPDGTILLSSATLLSGVLAYAFHVIAARSLGASTYGLVAVLWAAMFIAVVVLFRPLEQTISRAVADRLVRDEEVRSVMRASLLIYGGLAVGLALSTVVFWRPLNDRLFLGHSFFVLALAVGTIAYGGAYVLRGACGGIRWFQGYGAGLLADGTVRIVILIPIVFVSSGNLAAAAIAGAALGGALVPLALGRRRLAPLAQRGSGTPFHLRSAASFAAPAAAVAAADQLLVNGGPLFVMLSGGKDAGKTAGIVFAATMIVRIPVFFFTGLAASLLPNLTRLNASGDTAEFHRMIARATSLFAAVAGMIVIFGATIGPQTLLTVYGPAFQTSHLDLALLGVAAGGYLAAATLAQALLALASGRTAAAIWCTSAAMFVVGYMVVPGSQMFRVALSMAAATVFAALASTIVLMRRKAA